MADILSAPAMKTLALSPLTPPDAPSAGVVAAHSSFPQHPSQDERRGPRPTPTAEKRKASQEPIEDSNQIVKRIASNVVQNGQIPHGRTVRSDRVTSHQITVAPYTFPQPAPYAPYAPYSLPIPRPNAESSWSFSPNCDCTQCKAFRQGAIAHNQSLLARYPQLQLHQSGIQPLLQPIPPPTRVLEVHSAQEAMKSLQDIFCKLRDLKEEAPMKVDVILTELEGRVRELGRWIQREKTVAVM